MSIFWQIKKRKQVKHDFLKSNVDNMLNYGLQHQLHNIKYFWTTEKKFSNFQQSIVDDLMCFYN